MSNMIDRILSMINRPGISLLALIGRDTVVHKSARVFRFARIRNGIVGAYSYIGPRTRMDNTSVGAYCSISWDCQIGLSSHNLDSISTSPIFFEKRNGTGSSWVNQDHKDGAGASRTIIGNDVWVGARSTILESIVVGDGAVIGVGAVVTKDVPPYAIVGGVPAKVIRYRFDSDVREALLASKWWEEPPVKLKELIGSFQERIVASSQIERFKRDLSSLDRPK